METNFIFGFVAYAAALLVWHFGINFASTRKRFEIRAIVLGIIIFLVASLILAGTVNIALFCIHNFDESFMREINALPAILT